MKYLLLLSLLVTACGGAGDCPETETVTRVTDNTGTYYLRCWEWQCPGFNPERRCRRE